MFRLYSSPLQKKFNKFNYRYEDEDDHST